MQKRDRYIAAEIEQSKRCHQKKKTGIWVKRCKTERVNGQQIKGTSQWSDDCLLKMLSHGE